MTLDPRLTDTHVLALTLYAQSRGRETASFEELLALGCLIRNRVLNGRSWREVCLDYPCWDEDDYHYRHVVDAMNALLHEGSLDPRYLEAAWVAIGMINGYCRDVLKGATLAHRVEELPRPEWAQTLIPNLTYARQIFYRPHEALE